VLAVEPNINELPHKWQTRLELAESEAALKRADVVLLLVDHKPFKAIDPATLSRHQVVDCRGIWRHC
jgi:UDP-N-acetyl-D-mannosaminuronic acid dehydrogenase